MGTWRYHVQLNTSQVTAVNEREISKKRNSLQAHMAVILYVSIPLLKSM